MWATGPASALECSCDFGGNLAGGADHLAPAEPKGDRADELVVVVTVHVVERRLATVEGPPIELDDDAVLGIPDVALVAAERALLTVRCWQPVSTLDSAGVTHLKWTARAGCHFLQEVREQRPIRVPHSCR